MRSCSDDIRVYHAAIVCFLIPFEGFDSHLDWYTALYHQKTGAYLWTRRRHRQLLFPIVEELARPSGGRRGIGSDPLIRSASNLFPSPTIHVQRAGDCCAKDLRSDARRRPLLVRRCPHVGDRRWLSSRRADRPSSGPASNRKRPRAIW